MKKEPLVDVCVITYNHEDFISTCLESILAQSYQNFRILVGDDASTDNTQKIVKSYQDRFPGKIQLISSMVNTGASANCNRVVSEIKGKYIAWISGDDSMLPEKLNRQVEYMESDPECVFTYHDLDCFEDSTGKTNKLSQQSRQYTLSGNLHTILKYGHITGSSSLMVRNKKTIYFDTRIPLASDWLYLVDLLYPDGKFHYIDEVLGRYRRHDLSVTRSKAEACNIDLINSMTIAAFKYRQYSSQILQKQYLKYVTLGLLSRGVDDRSYNVMCKLVKRIGNKIKKILSYSEPDK